MNYSNCMVAQSGGPTVAINASLAGVVAAVLETDHYNTCYGAVNGILGILNEHYLDLTKLAQDDSNNLTRLSQTPAMFLGSCRHKLPSYEEDVAPYITIFEQFEKYQIGAFFYIGGNDSMDTVLKLSAYASHINSPIRIVGIPKTIDNDLCVTDHTPGYGSAAKYVAATMLEIAHDTFIYPVKSVTIVEIMGRDAGWLTAASALARNTYNCAPHFIYLPEVAFDTEVFINDISDALKKNNNIIVAVSEGIHDKDGKYISASSASLDQFGHQQLSGAGKALEYLVADKIGVKVRSVEINVLQRCAAHMASATDQKEAFEQGRTAVKSAADGQTGVMVCLRRVSNTPYTVEYFTTEISGIANLAKEVPVEWINEAGNDVKKELVDYIAPLILGEVPVTYENGLPNYMDVSHLKNS